MVRGVGYARAVLEGERHTIDQLDRAIIDRLRRNGREGNRSLAKALEVSEATVASRIRRLEAAGIMRVVALTDMFGLAGGHLVFGLIDVEASDIAHVADALAAVPETISVTICGGRYAIVVTALVRDFGHLDALLGQSLKRINGIRHIRAELAIDVLRFDSMWAVLGREMQETVTISGDKVDDLDREIVRLLQINGRSSNRQLARDLSVSEGTIRARLGRLQGENLIRIQAVSDITAFGLGAYALLGISVVGDAIANVADELLKRADFPELARTIGEFDFMAVMTAADHVELTARVMDELGPIDGIQHIDVFESWRSVKHNYLWARLL
jgi:DNA-binding Lrp family transcriptional regulator